MADYHKDYQKNLEYAQMFSSNFSVRDLEKYPHLRFMHIGLSRHEKDPRFLIFLSFQALMGMPEATFSIPVLIDQAGDQFFKIFKASFLTVRQIALDFYNRNEGHLNAIESNKKVSEYQSTDPDEDFNLGQLNGQILDFIKNRSEDGNFQLQDDQ